MSSAISSIWLIGLSNAGKTTLANLLAKRVRDGGGACLLIDGNEMRDLFDRSLGFDPASRRKQTERIKKLVKWANRNGILAVVAIIHPFEDDRAACRASLQGYFELFLKCGIKECIRRDRKDVYMPAIRGEKKHVVGVDIPYEQPAHADLSLDSEANSPEQLLDRLWDEIAAKLPIAGR